MNAVRRLPSYQVTLTHGGITPQPRHRRSDTVFTKTQTTPVSPAPQHDTTTIGQRIHAVARRAADDIRARVGIAALFLLAASTAIFANGDNSCHCAVTATDAPLVE